MFRSITEEHLIGLVKQAGSRCIFVAPGVSVPLSTALVAALGRCSVWSVIVDGDEESCRLGYGDAHALNSLHEAASSGNRAVSYIRQCY